MLMPEVRTEGQILLDAGGAKAIIYTYQERPRDFSVPEACHSRFGEQGEENTMTIREVLKEFMLTPAPSGYEQEMAYTLKKRFEENCSEVTLDRVGNVIARIPGKDPSLPRTMLFAHMDQLGFIVRKIEPDGFLQVDRLGGIPEKVLPALEVSVRSEEGKWIPGIFGTKAHHAAAPEDKYKVDPVTSMFIDLGARDAAEVKALGIEIGCPVIYKPAFRELVGSRISGTAVDNRGSCAVLVEIAKQLHTDPPAGDVWLVGTVWEEFNLRGAMMAARTVKPDIAISLDVALAGDTHDLSGRYEDALGEGATVHLYSFHGRGTLNGTLPHGPLYGLAARTARETDRPLQRFASLGILTDAAYLQLEGEGVACLEMGFPARYTHTPVETCDTRDLQTLADLCTGITRRIDGSFQLSRY